MKYLEWAKSRKFTQSEWDIEQKLPPLKTAQKVQEVICLTDAIGKLINRDNLLQDEKLSSIISLIDSNIVTLKAMKATLKEDVRELLEEDIL